jgi:hypothetical protein
MREAKSDEREHDDIRYKRIGVQDDRRCRRMIGVMIEKEHHEIRCRRSGDADVKTYRTYD